MTTYAEAQRQVHEALGALLDNDEFVMSWVVTLDVAGPDERRYLAHRAGGGADGTENPTIWAALGMMEASVGVARAQLADATVDLEDDDPED